MNSKLWRGKFHIVRRVCLLWRSAGHLFCEMLRDNSDNPWDVWISFRASSFQAISNKHNCCNNNNCIKICDNKLPVAQEKEKEAVVEEEDEEYRKFRQLLDYDDVSPTVRWSCLNSNQNFISQAPAYLQFNPFIRKGYRNMLPSNLCWESIFWWTNETVNIWSHIFGLFLFIALSVNDIAFLKIHAHFVDKLIVGALLVCFQICMCLSSFYHIFCCRSEKDYECFLTYDLFGIALSLLAIYISGIYYAFWCHSVSPLASLAYWGRKL